MDALLCTARNIRHGFDDKGELVAEIEAVFTTTHMCNEFINGGAIVNVNKTSTVRFAISPEAARKVSEKFLEWADEADAESERLIVKREDSAR